MGFVSQQTQAGPQPVAAATKQPCDQLQSIVLNAAAVIGVTTIAPRPKGASQV